MIANIMQNGRKLYSKSFLPNSAGFRFLAFTRDHNKYRCEIVRGADGLHRVEGCAFSEIVGWTNALEVVK